MGRSSDAGGPIRSQAGDLPGRTGGRAFSRNAGEICAAVSVGLLGLYLVTKGIEYSVGTFRQMGPGFYPLALGLILVAFSAGLCVEGARAEAPAEPINWRPLLFVVASVGVFALVAPRFGLIPATVALVLLSALSERSPSPGVAIGTAIGLSVAGYLIFLYFLKLPIAAFRW